MRVHRCPECALKGRNHGFNLKVIALVECDLQQQFPTKYTNSVKTFPTICNHGDKAIWGDESTMTCQICNHTGRAIEFVSEYIRESEQVVTEYTYAR